MYFCIAVSDTHTYNTTIILGMSRQMLTFSTYYIDDLLSVCLVHYNAL